MNTAELARCILRPSTFPDALARRNGVPWCDDERAVHVERGQPALDPARSYLFYAERPAGPLAPDIVFAGHPKDLESAEADLRFLRDAVANNAGTDRPRLAQIPGSRRSEAPDSARRCRAPRVTRRPALRDIDRSGRHVPDHGRSTRAC